MAQTFQIRIPNIFLCFFLAFLFSGCAKKGNKSVPDARPSLECLSKIKNDIVQNKIFFTDQPETNLDDGLLKVNHHMASIAISKEDYEISQKRGSNFFHTIAKKVYYKNQTSNFVIETTILPGEDGSKYKYELSLEYSEDNIPANSSTVIVQNYNVSDNCELQFSSVEYKDMRQVGQSIRKETASYNTIKKEGPDIETKAFQGQPPICASEVPTDKPEGLLQLVKSQNTYAFDVGVISFLQLEIQQTDTRGKSFLIEYVSPDTDDTFKVEFKFSDESPYTSILENGEFTYTVDLNTWLHTYPTSGHSKSFDIQFDTNPYEDELPLGLTIWLNKELKFPNMRAYWNIIQTDKITDNPNYNYKYKMVGRQKHDSLPSILPLDTSRSTSPYLGATKDLETSLPQIQAWSEELLKNFKGNRIDMALKILKLVNSYLTYDGKMVEENLVQGLKTSEILERKKGVCQHFANLFTTIARAVGLPTRTVFGVSLHPNSSAMHAWVESEFADGIWLPLEPQSESGKIYFSRYLPLAYDAEGGTDFKTAMQLISAIPDAMMIRDTTAPMAK
ncbi:MAG: transglutaminase domain-containing protein [Bdellovibrionales bacterium]|nr:transglutaminase domain-containing protein [Bdellovibrionales bacterium]